MHKSQVFLYSLYAFVVGVAFASFFTISDKVILYSISTAILVLAVCAYKGTFPHTPTGAAKREIGFLVGFLILIFSIGVARFYYFAEQKNTLAQFTDVQVGGKNLEFNLLGYVDSHPEISNGRQRFVFRVKGVQGGERIISLNEKILVTTNLLPMYSFGHPLTVQGALKKPQNFNDFDYVTYLKRDSIHTLVSFPKIQSYDVMQLDFFESIKITFLSWIFSVRDNFQAAINRSIPEPSASYVNGILLGVRQNIPEDLKEAFEKTSTTHILAISGYNIAIIAQALLLALVYFFKRRTAFWISVAVIIIFTIMVGASASVIRASVMGLLLLFANGFGRLYDVRSSIVFAGAAMIALNPMALVFDIGFQLSFLAVIGLIYLYPILDKKITKVPQWQGIRELALMTVSAQIFVLPLLIYYFKNFSIVSLPANIIILPFVPAAMLFGFLTGLAGMFSSWLGWALGIVAWAVTNFQIKVIEYFADLSFSSLTVSIHPITMIALYGLLFFFVWRSSKKEKLSEEKTLSSIKSK